MLSDTPISMAQLRLFARESEETANRRSLYLYDESLHTLGTYIRSDPVIVRGRVQR